jgi:hypothetical protein
MSLTTAEFWFERRPWNRLPTVLAVAGLMLLADWLTGPYIRFPALFILPVLMAAWNQGFFTAATLGLGLSLGRLLATDLPGSEATLTSDAINAALRAFVFTLIAFLTRLVAVQTRALREEVRQLEGILPICGFCKAIRDEQGQWRKLESYVSEHSKASFTHGLCPECAQKHYGQFLNGGEPPQGPLR